MSTTPTRAAILALAVLAGLLFSTPAQAQEPSEPVDLSVTIEVTVTETIQGGTSVYVANHGSVTAYDVEVDIALAKMLPKTTRKPLFRALTPDAGTLTYDPDVPYRANWLWQIRQVPPHTEYGVEFLVQSNPPWTVIQYTATVRSSSWEPKSALGNNRTEAWQVAAASSSVPAQPDYSVQVSVDNRYPEPGDTVNFTVTASRPGLYLSPSLFADACVNIQLTPGLTAGTPTFAPIESGLSYNAGGSETCGVTSLSSVSGVFQVGGPQFQLSGRTRVEEALNMTLPATVGGDATIDEQCLTAEMFATPPTGTGRPYDDASDNRARLCLGELPPVTFISGATDLFTFYPCVGVTDYPCTDTDTVEQVALGGTAAQLAGLDPNVVLQPEDVAVRVPDPEGRTTDDDGNLFWATKNHDVPSGVGFLGNSQELLPSPPWDNANYSIAVSGIDGGTKPGFFKYYLQPSGHGAEEILLRDADTKTGGNPFGPGFRADVFITFGALGTYLLTRTIYVEHDEVTDTTLDCDAGTTGVQLCDAGVYTFHVGPAAELAVQDGGASPHAKPDQIAFTVLPVNNGPDDAVGALMDVKLPVGTTGVETIPPGLGTFNSSATPNPTWTWDIGALQDLKYLIGTGQPVEEPVTLIVSGVEVGATATSTVSHDNANHPYQVCIGSEGDDVDAADQASCEAVDGASWHTGTVFDHIDDNNTATLTARPGTGEGPPGVPALQSAQGDSSVVVVEWAPVDELNGWPVSHYQVWRSASPWEMVADYVTDTRYLDGDVPPGTRPSYRVRAVNIPGAAGPWSAVMEGRVAAAQTRTEIVYRDRVVTRTRTVEVEVPEEPYAHFAEDHFTRSVLENSAPGSPVGAPVAVIRNSVNEVTYSLEGTDAALFDIEEDSGQILVAAGTVLDFESERTAYTVEVVAHPESRGTPRAAVTVNVVDVEEVGSVSITPAGQPQVGAPLTATLTHDGGEPGDPRWQWQRTNADGHWSDIEGADGPAYTPTERDAGRLLRATVVYVEPDDGGESVMGAVTETVAGEPLAYFAAAQYTHSVAENSGPGTHVGAPVTVVSGSASGVTYTLEGPDAALFDIDAESGQIVVGAGTALDYESGRTAYSVEVVAQPAIGVGSSATVTINVTDVSEVGSVSITPAGHPQVGVLLTAVLTHDGGEPVDPRWQWQRLGPEGIWNNIEGAGAAEYTPTDHDAGRRLQATVVYVEPDDGGESVMGAVTETVVGEPLAYFSAWEHTRTVTENSGPGTQVGAPVAVVSGSASGVRYTLEGPDAALFDIGADSGQIVVGGGTVLDYESGRTAYSVEVVAQPAIGVGSSATVTINVTDVSEVGSVSITPTGQPQVGVLLTAVLTHDGGEPADPRWQWQRTNADGRWSDIEGADGPAYTPTERDAGRRLQATVVYIEPDDGSESVVGAVTETVAGEPLAYFSAWEHTRSVTENSDPGTQVGAPVAVVSGSASGVTYTLEGPDAGLFDIGADTGQIVVGAGTVLDFESGRTAYSVEVVAQPATGVGSRATVTINVTDVSEVGSVSITPAGQPQVGVLLTAVLIHDGGEPADPRWQWQRTNADGIWSDIEGAESWEYTPTERDAGRRLQATVVYVEPDGDGESVMGAVTEAVTGETLAYFAAAQYTHSVAENSGPGTLVGAPVTVVSGSASGVRYTLEGPDAGLFDIGADSGQISVGAGTVLDFESERTAYSVEVVVQPATGVGSRATVTINVMDVSEAGFPLLWGAILVAAGAAVGATGIAVVALTRRRMMS